MIIFLPLGLWVLGVIVLIAWSVGYSCGEDFGSLSEQWSIGWTDGWEAASKNNWNDVYWDDGFAAGYSAGMKTLIDQGYKLIADNGMEANLVDFEKDITKSLELRRDERIMELRKIKSESEIDTYEEDEDEDEVTRVRCNECGWEGKETDIYIPRHCPMCNGYQGLEIGETMEVIEQ